MCVAFSLEIIAAISLAFIRHNQLSGNCQSFGAVALVLVILSAKIVVQGTVDMRRGMAAFGRNQLHWMHADRALPGAHGVLDFLQSMRDTFGATLHKQLCVS